MNTSINSLSGEELVLLAGIRLSVTAHLAAAAAAIDGELGALCGKSFSLSLSAIGVGDRARLDCSGGRVAACFGERPAAAARGSPGGMLVFPSARACARALAGGRGAILPLPFGPAFPRALRFFKAAAGKVPQLLRSPEVSPRDRAGLLLAASLHGLSAVAGDSWLEKRMLHFPDGTVRIEAGDAVFFVEKKGRGIRVLRDPAAPQSTQAAPQSTQAAPLSTQAVPQSTQAATGNAPAAAGADALLSFASPESAIAVLSGKRQAVVALGSGEVRIAGLLPLVQGLFAVLDRLSWYLGVTIGEEGK